MWKVEPSFHAGLMGAAAVLSAVAVATFAGSVRWSGLAEDVAGNYEVLSEIDRTLAAVTDAETGQRGYVLTGDAIYLSTYHSGAAASWPAFEKLAARAGQYPELKTGLVALRPLIAQKLGELAQTVTLRRTDGFARAYAVVAEGKGRRIMERIRALIAGMRADQEKTLLDRQTRMRPNRLRTLSTSFAGSFFTILIIVVFSRRAGAAAGSARRVQQRLDAFMQNNPSVAFIKDADGRMVYCNAAFEQVFQLHREEWSHRDDFALWPEEVARKLREADVAVLAEKKPTEVIERVPLPSGETREFLSVKFPFRQDDQVYLGGISFDITQTRADAAALKASEGFNRSILQSSQDCIKVLDLEGRLLSINENGQILLGISDPATLLWKDWASFWKDDEHRAASRAIAAGRRGETTHFRGCCPSFDGEQRWWDVVVSPIQDENRGLSKLLVVSRDITKTKTAEAQLKQSEEKFRCLFESSSDAILLTCQGKVVDCNPATVDMLGAERKELIVGMASSRLLAEVQPDGMRSEALAADMRKETSRNGLFRRDLLHRRLNGEEFLVDLTMTGVEINGTAMRLVIWHDLTERNRAERKVLAALADKDVLLQEVHHRVKNNLQVICSLLGMQAATLDDPQTVAALHESQDRVQSMAMIHELLYGSKTLSDIDFFDYAERLTGELAASYGLGSRVRLHLDMAPIRFSLDQAIPCGLILNELISNALKYAFPEEREGAVTISLAEHGHDRLALVVQDDGVGLPGGFRLETARSLGLRIVRILSEQLNGSFHVESRRGARFEIIFPSGCCAQMARQEEFELVGS